MFATYVMDMTLLVQFVSADEIGDGKHQSLLCRISHGNGRVCPLAPARLGR